MNSFEHCLEIGRNGEDELVPFIGKHLARNGQVTLLRNSPLALKLQQHGDIFYNCIEDGSLKTLEIKTEKEAKYGNFFFEIWSNRKIGRVGWMCNQEVADALGYYFMRERWFFLMKFVPLRAALFNGKPNPDNWNYQKFTLKKQGKYIQENDTWGYPVPFQFIRGFTEVMLRKFYISSNQLEIDEYYLAKNIQQESVRLTKKQQKQEELREFERRNPKLF